MAPEFDGNEFRMLFSSGKSEGGCVDGRVPDAAAFGCLEAVVFDANPPTDA